MKKASQFLLLVVAVLLLTLSSASALVETVPIKDGDTGELLPYQRFEIEDGLKPYLVQFDVYLNGEFQYYFPVKVFLVFDDKTGELIALEYSARFKGLNPGNYHINMQGIVNFNGFRTTGFQSDSKKITITKYKAANFKAVIRLVENFCQQITISSFPGSFYSNQKVSIDLGNDDYLSGQMKEDALIFTPCMPWSDWGKSLGGKVADVNKDQYSFSIPFTSQLDSIIYETVFDFKDIQASGGLNIEIIFESDEEEEVVADLVVTRPISPVAHVLQNGRNNFGSWLVSTKDNGATQLNIFAYQIYSSENFQPYFGQAYLYEKGVLIAAAALDADGFVQFISKSFGDIGSSSIREFELLIDVYGIGVEYVKMQAVLTEVNGFRHFDARVATVGGLPSEGPRLGN